MNLLNILPDEILDIIFLQVGEEEKNMKDLSQNKRNYDRVMKELNSKIPIEYFLIPKRVLKCIHNKKSHDLDFNCVEYYYSRLEYNKVLMELMNIT